jgi:autotransporter-associated beta strand protein
MGAPQFSALAWPAAKHRAPAPVLLFVKPHLLFDITPRSSPRGLVMTYRYRRSQSRRRSFRSLVMEKFESRELMAITPLNIQVYDGTDAGMASADNARGSSVTAQPSNPIGQNAQPSLITLADIGSNGDGNYPGQSSVPAPGGGDSYAVFIVGKVKIDNTNNPSGMWTFGSFSDDNSRIRIDLDRDGLLEGSLNSVGGIANETVLWQGGCCGVVLGPAVAIPNGTYLIEMAYTEGNGGDYGEFFYAPGNPGFSTTNYALVGDDRLGISLNLNEAPVLNNLSGDVGNGGLAYVPNAPGVLLDSGTLATMTDADNPANVGGATLKIKTLLGGETNDVLLPKTDGGNNVRSGPGATGTTTVGSFSGGTNGTDLVITFSASATVADVSDVLQNIRFAHTSATANNSSRLFSWTYDDGQNGSATVNTTLNLQLGDGVANVRIWDGSSDGVSWTDASNWQGDIAPDADDIARFTGIDPGDINLSGTQIVGSVEFTSGNYNLIGGTLETKAITNSSGNNSIASQIRSAALAGNVTGGQLALANMANVSSLLGGVWTIATGGKIVATTSNANSGLGLANVDLTGGNLEFGPAPATTINGFQHAGFARDSGDANFNLNNNGGMLNAPAGDPTAISPSTRASFKGQTTRTGPLSFPDEASLLADGVMGGLTDNYNSVWYGYLTTTETGNWQFQRTFQDDWTGIWVDIDQDGVLESSVAGLGSDRGEQLAYNDGNVKTVNLTNPLGTGKYLVAFTHLEGGGGANAGFNFKSPSGSSLVTIDPSSPAQAGLWTTQAVAAGKLSNNIHVLSDSTITLGAGMPGAALNQLTIDAGKTLNVVSPDTKQDLEFASVVLNGNGTINGTGAPDITLRNISQTAAADITYSGTGTVLLPTNNSYTGLTTINSGVTVNVSSNGALGTIAGGTVVQSGGSLQLSGNVIYSAAEPLTLNGNGTSTSDAALLSLSGNNDFYGPITLNSSAKIRSASGNLRLFGQINYGSNNLELRADAQMEIWAGISGSGAITKTGGNRTIMVVNADAGTNFSGQLNINEGIWDARGNNSLGTTAGPTIVNNGARLEIRDGKTLADNITITGNSGGNGAIRSENNSNTLTGTITMSGDAMIYVNATQLTITGQIVGNRLLTKAGAGALILKQDNQLSNFDLGGGEVRISTQNGLGSATSVSVDSGETLSFDNSLNFNGGTTLQSIYVNNGTLSATSGTTTLDIPINVGILGNIAFSGAGNLNILRPFGNGNTPITNNFLNHYGFRRDAGDAVFNLDNNGGMLNNLSPTTHPTYTGQALLTGALSFPNEASLLASGVFNTSISGYQDNYSNLWVGYLTSTEVGNWQFQRTLQDDWTGMWIDIDQDGVLESSVAGLGSNRGEQLAYNDGGVKTVNLTNSNGSGRYLVAFTQLEGGGEANAAFQFKSPSGASLALINPSAQPNLWQGLVAVTPTTNVSKTGTGTVTFSAANTYNGATTISGGTLVAANSSALGVGAGGVTVNDGATLALTNNVAITGKPITANGAGAAGQPGAIANLSGNNSYTGALTAAIASAGNLGIGSTSGTLTLGGTIDLKFSQLTFGGAGNVVVNSAISGTGVNSLATGISETIYKSFAFPNNGAAQNDIESIRNTPLGAQDGRGVQLGDINYPNNDAVAARAISYGASSFPNNTGWTMVWVTTFTPNESGQWGFRFNYVDDDASMWIDTTGTPGVFDATSDRFYSRGCCGNSGDQLTPNLIAGQQYTLGIVARDFNGGSFTGLQFKSPTAAGVTGGNWVNVNATSYPTTFQTLSVAKNDLVKNGSGTVTLAGNNTYNGKTTINTGTLIAANNNALGSTAVGTSVASGATLGLQGGVTINGEALTLNGLGASGMPGALVNISGNNTIDVGSPITAQLVSLGQIGIGSIAGTLAVNSGIDLKSSKLVVDGAGATTINGVISGTGVDVGSNPPENAGAVTGVFTNVPEANNYILAYELTATNNVNGANPFPYTRDNTATIQPFDRVAYYLELQSGSGPLQYVYVSMDAFTNNLAQIGIPNGSNLFKWQQKVNNLNVVSNSPAITTGTGLATGNIEIWPSNYGGQNDIGIPNADGNTYDFGDGGSNTGLGYGSFQIHNYDIDGAGPGTTGQVIMAYNNWRGGGDLGIGSAPSGQPDYTFANNLAGYTIKRMAILVHETAPRLIQTSNALVKNGSGTLTLNAANTYNAGTTINSGVLLANNTTGSATGPGAVTANGGTFGGNGSIAGALALQTGANLSPGTGTADLAVGGNLNLTGGSTFRVDINGPNANTQYDQLITTGAVNLNNATLNVTLASTATFPTNNQVFRIIDNQGSGAIAGTFAGLAEGATLVTSSGAFRVSYVGGTGNDVTLTALVPTVQFSAATFSAGEGAGTTNVITLTRTGALDAPTQVRVSITGGTATGGGALPADYNNSGWPLTINFAANQNSVTVPLTIFDDTATDLNETVIFALAGQSNATLGAQTAATLTIIDNDNQPPVAVNDTAGLVRVNENAGAVNITGTKGVANSGVLGNDSDPDNDPLTITSINTAGITKGTLTLNAGVLTYNPNGAFSLPGGVQDTTQSFQYTISDGKGGTATATATITVVGINDAPVLGPPSSSSVTVNEGTPISITGAYSDSDGDNVTFTAKVNGVDRGTITKTGPSSGTWTWNFTPPDGNAGPFTVVVTASDGTNQPTTSFTYTVLNVAPVPSEDNVLINDVPQDTSSGNVAVVAGLPVTFEVSATDAAADSVDAPFTFVIDFGDGQTATDFTTSEGAPLQFTHTYPPLTNAQPRTYQPFVTVRDKDGATSARLDLTPIVVQQQAAIDGILYVAGTNAADRIIVQSTSTGVRIRMNNVLLPAESVGEKVVVFGHGGNDNITVTGALAPSVEFYGGAGDDYLAGGSYDDTLDGGPGKDRLLGGNGNDILLGGDGNDTLSGGNGNDYLAGDSYIDLVGGTVDPLDPSHISLPGEILTSESAGNDLINADAGDDTLLGGGGNDTLNGGAGNDFIRGNDGKDKEDGGAGDDLLSGDEGADILYGRAGQDVLIGGASSDTIYGSTGADLIYGGDFDSFVLDDLGLDDLWMLWTSGDFETASGNLSSAAIDDNVGDTLHGEADADWYLTHVNDVFKLASEKKAPNVILPQ